MKAKRIARKKARGMRLFVMLCVALFASVFVMVNAGAWGPVQAVPGKWEVHEWGTFTSMQGTNGKLLAGMHHDEEHLPRFVHNRVTHGRGAFKGNMAGSPPAGVTQKLETPVIYFYTDRPRKVKVKVDFPKGVISEWYPRAKTFSPPLSFSKKTNWTPKGGSMTWEGLARPGKARFPWVHPTNIWAPSRQVPAAAPFVVSTKRYNRTYTEADKFIFYRGLGRFRSWVRVSSSPKNPKEWTLHNRSKQSVPGGLLMHVTRHGGSWRVFGAIDGRSSLKVKAPETPGHMGVFLTNVKRELVKMLVKSGLTKDESWAMVHTWHKSYFKTPGTRVLYIVPRAWTDELLPIRISPRPKKLVRTLVGRIEFLTHAEENDLVRRVKQAYAMKMNYHQIAHKPGVRHYYYNPLGRLAEPKLRRTCQLLKVQHSKLAMQVYCNKMVAQARYDLTRYRMRRR